MHSPMRQHSAAPIVMMGGLVAGLCDITYAVVFSGFRGVPAQRVLQSVASGLLGKAAYDGGAPVAALGLGLHFFIALSFAAIFYIASRALPLLVRRPAISGVLYGAAIYGFMNFVVLPLSRFPRKFTFNPLVFTTGLLVHMFLIGIPIALAARKAAGSSSLPAAAATEAAM